MEEVICDPGSDKVPVPGIEKAAVELITTPEVVHTGVPTTYGEGFTVVQRRKKKGGIIIPSKKQKPVVIRTAHVQYKANPISSAQTQNGSGSSARGHSSVALQDVTNRGATKSASGGSKGGNLPSKGFDFSRAVNGKGGNTHRVRGVRATDMDVWEQGEHDFFEDQVKAMGLDYDYFIEDVDSDDDNGTAQFFAAQMKVGMPKVLLPTPPHLSK
ncbi:hypothetical protein L1987_58656 [Smallanthus sonchifolius]|uniref:Uncharacterized protein n=1 Tax=Smallanthus sonchifolius TaxID=185202 RepID=A0ACB9DGX8_9ASTR|nr:hypothetical protein L1987_58656 [Smallanthus sonchifolius]